MFQKYKSTDPIENSRRYMILEGITGIGQFSLTTGAFLAGFLNFLGASKQLNGIIAVVPAMTGVFQIISPLIFERFSHRKKPLLILAIFYRAIIPLTFFLPLLFLKLGIGLPIFIVVFFIAYCLHALLVPVVSNWIVDLTPLEIRGHYLAKREKISLFIIGLLTIILSQVLDLTKAQGAAVWGFFCIGVVLLIFGILNLVSLIRSVEVEGKNVKSTYRFKDVLSVPLRDKGFRKVILLFMIWSFALQVGGPFISVYMVTDLSLSYTYITMCSVIAIIARVACTSLWGRLADQKSWFLSTKMSLLILAIGHFSWSFVSKSNGHILIPFLHIITGIAWGGIGISLFNIQFLFAKQKGRTLYLALNNAISGIVSILAAAVGGYIVKAFGDKTYQFLILHYTNFHLIFMISGIGIFLCSIFVHFYIERGTQEITTD